MDTSNYKFLTHEGALASNFVALSVWCAFAMLLRQHNVVISL